MDDSCTVWLCSVAALGGAGVSGVRLHKIKGSIRKADESEYAATQ